MRSKKAFLNTITSLILEVVAVISGFILPRLILFTFGSSYNGIISAISQFISYISLLSAGIGGVTRASLYEPLEEDDTRKVSAILKATEIFMRKIAFFFVFGLIAFATLYPLLVIDEFDWLFTFTLVLILGIGTFAQYYFGITYRMLLQADQKQYVFIVIQIITTIVNTAISAILIISRFSMHMVQLGSTFIFMLNPIVIFIYVRQKYKIVHDVIPDNNAIKQRWDAFAHEIANFVNRNTDLVILSFFSNVREISVYTIYNMISIGIRKIIYSFTTGIDAAFGNMIARKEKDALDRNMDVFEFLIYTLSIILFSSTGILIASFVSVYTKGITDADYYRLGFGYLIAASEFFFCIRMPYQALTNAAGHYRQTRNAAIVEVTINIILSLVFVNKLGLVGVIIGTLGAMIYRTLLYSIYVSRNILYRSILIVIRRLCLSLLNILAIVVLVRLIDLPEVNTYWDWAINGLVVFGVATAITGLLSILFYMEDIKALIQIVKRSVAKKTGKEK